jgi:hypothetical protein
MTPQEYYRPDSNEEAKKSSNEFKPNSIRINEETVSVDDMIRGFHLDDLTIRGGSKRLANSANSQQSRISKRQLKRRNDLGNTVVSRNFRDGTKEQREKRRAEERR